jgi:hypothetical protein
MQRGGDRGRGRGGPDRGRGFRGARGGPGGGRGRGGPGGGGFAPREQGGHVIILSSVTLTHALLASLQRVNPRLSTLALLTRRRIG